MSWLKWLTNILTDRSYLSENLMVISKCPLLRLNPDQMWLNFSACKANTLCYRKLASAYSYTDWISRYGDVNEKLGTALSLKFMNMFRGFVLQWIGHHMNIKLWSANKYDFILSAKINFSILSLHVRHQIYVISGHIKTIMVAFCSPIWHSFLLPPKYASAHVT